MLLRSPILGYAMFRIFSIGACTISLDFDNRGAYLVSVLTPGGSAPYQRSLIGEGGRGCAYSNHQLGGYTVIFHFSIVGCVFVLVFAI